MKITYILPLAAACVLTLTGCSDGGPSQLELSRQNGIEQMNNGQFEDAIRSFEYAYALCDERMPKTKTDLALYEASCLWNLKEYDALITLCDQILELQNSKDAYYLKGSAYLQQGLEEEAGAAFDLAAQYGSDDYQLLLNIYHQYEEISKSAVGDTYLQKALDNPNDTMEDYYQKGYIYYYLGEYEEALDELAKPVENGEEDAMLLMGQSYLRLNENVKGRNIFLKYLEAYPNSAKAYNGLALCDLADKAYDSALSNIGKGLDVNPDEDTLRELLYNEIVAYEMKQDFETAKVKAESFARNYPDDEDGNREFAFLSTR